MCFRVVGAVFSNMNIGTRIISKMYRYVVLYNMPPVVYFGKYCAGSVNWPQAQDNTPTVDLFA